MRKRRPPVGPQPDGSWILNDSTQIETFQISNLDDVRTLLDDALERAGKPVPGWTPAVAGQNMADQMAFIQRLGNIVQAVRSAEADGQWDMARPFLSSRFYRRWQPWAEGLARAGQRRPLNLVREITSGPMQSNQGFDRVTIRVSEADPTARTAPVVTLWTFIRSSRGSADNGGTGAPSVCANCGAPVDSTTETACRYCGAGIAVLGPEWILDDVSPEGAASAPAGS